MADDDDGGVAMATDWWDSGWERFLPRQAIILHMVVATATVREVDGPLDDLVGLLGPNGFVLRTGGFDAPLWWSFPDEKPAAEQLELDRRTQARFEATLAAAGRDLPRTVRDLASLMAELGVFDHTVVDGVHRWRSPETLPLVAERLPVPDDFAADEDRFRWASIHEAAAQAVIRYIHAVGRPDAIRTSLAELATAVELELDDVRFGLAVLVDDGDFSLLDATGGLVDPETVSDGKHVTLAVDWERFEETRFTVRRNDGDDD
jgi:hypothetical protein